MSTVKQFFLETRPQFLILTPCAFSVGIAASVYTGNFRPWNMLLALVGAILAHVVVNVSNDYYDYKRGTDALVNRTPFSGGSGMVGEDKVKPSQAFTMAAAALVLGLAIGTYFIIRYPVLLPIVAASAFITWAYTPLFTRMYITEIFPGLGFGPLLVMGAAVIQLSPGSSRIPAEAVWASIPVGILVTGLLWINEIPDYDADRQTGRKHAVILLGRRRAAIGYVVLLALAYLSLVVPVALGKLPVPTLLGLLTLPVAVKAGRGALAHYDDTAKLIPALGQNVIVDLATPVLITIGFLVAKLIA